MSSPFDCNICLEALNEPVVTQCGHLYCWPCLYTWIKPALSHDDRHYLGLDLIEPVSRRVSDTGDNGILGELAGSQRGLVSFILQAQRSFAAPIAADSSLSHSFTLPSLVPPGRSCCPVCKTPCSVKTIISIFARRNDLSGDEVDVDGRRKSLKRPIETEDDSSENEPNPQQKKGCCEKIPSRPKNVNSREVVHECS